jgi:RNA recognition motif-containing protein
MIACGSIAEILDPMNLFVGNLSFQSDEEELRLVFGDYGRVRSAAVIRDRITNRSRGFGFVEMDNEEEARTAIACLDGVELNGRRISVNEARPQGRG